MDAQLCVKKKSVSVMQHSANYAAIRESNSMDSVRFHGIVRGRSECVMEHAIYQGNVSRLFAVFDSPQQQ